MVRDDFLELRSQKELINMMESSKHDWRTSLVEEHPYVEVMPQQGKEAKVISKKDESSKEKDDSKKNESLEVDYSNIRTQLLSNLNEGNFKLKVN